MARKPNFTHPKNPIDFSFDNAPLQKSNRVARVSEIVRHTLADILLRTHFRHPGLAHSHLITVSEVNLTPDLKTAHIMVYPLFNKNEPTTLETMPPQVTAPQITVQKTADKKITPKKTTAPKSNRLPTGPLETTIQALNEASGFLRSLLAKKMTQRSVPSLKFYIDTRFDNASNINAILIADKNDTE